jgi:myo-inositol catabolism protein IolS
VLYLENVTLNRPLSRIAFGGASISGEGGGYGFGPMSERDAQELLKASWEHGINLYDTAPIYGFGLSEERFGRYLPKEAIIVSKSGVDWHSTKRVNMTNDPQVTLRMLHESLKRLRRDVIDVYMIHWPDPRVDIRHPMEVLERARQQGKIKKIGLCNTNLNDLRLATEISEVSFLQSELNLFNTSAFSELGDDWKQRLTMGWGTFDKGILSGRVQPQRKFPKEDCRSWAPWWNQQVVNEKIQQVSSLSEILKDYQLSLPEFCLQFNLFHFGISTTLIGLKSIFDLVEVTSNLQREFNRETMAEVLSRWKK